MVRIVAWGNKPLFSALPVEPDFMARGEAWNVAIQNGFTSAGWGGPEWAELFEIPTDQVAALKVALDSDEAVVGWAEI